MNANRLLLLIFAWAVLGTASERLLREAGAVTPVRHPVGFVTPTPSPSPSPRPTSTVLSPASACGNPERWFGTGNCVNSYASAQIIIVEDMTITRIVCGQSADPSCEVTFNVTHGLGTENGDNCVSVNQASCDKSLGTPIDLNVGVTGAYAIRARDTGANCTNTIGATCTVHYTVP